MNQQHNYVDTMLSVSSLTSEAQEVPGLGLSGEIKKWTTSSC